MQLSYSGGFKAGRRDGEGTLKENGMSYRGEFKADQYAGLGRLELEDGSSYQGQFAHGKPNGEGQRGPICGAAVHHQSTVTWKVTVRV